MRAVAVRSITAHQRAEFNESVQSGHPVGDFILLSNYGVREPCWLYPATSRLYRTPTLMHTDLREPIANGNSTRPGIVRIGDDFEPAEPELLERNVARHGDSARGNPARTMGRISPVRNVCSVVLERSEFTATEQFAGRHISHREGKPVACEALLFPSGDDVLGMSQRRDKRAWKLEPTSMLGVTVSAEQHGRITGHKAGEGHDSVGSPPHVNDDSPPCPQFRSLKHSEKNLTI
jgi:hypothetical protein